jgi:hypothetical protein
LRHLGLECNTRTQSHFSISQVTDTFDFDIYMQEIKQLFEEFAPSIPDEMNFLSDCRNAYDGLTDNLISKSSGRISRKRINDLVNGQDSNFEQFRCKQKAFICSIENKVPFDARIVFEI